MPEVSKRESDDHMEDSVAATASRRMELLTASLVTILGLAMFVGARSISLRNVSDGLDPKWWPTVISCGIIICGVWMFANVLIQGDLAREVAASSRYGWLQVAATIASLVAVLLLWKLGVTFLALGPAFLVGINVIYGLKNWKSLLLFPAIIALLLYVIFRLLLRIPL